MTTSPPGPGGTAPAGPARPRRRGDALCRAIHEAALALLSDTGYGGLTMEGVAERARTGKASLYRRWRSKRELVLDALGEALPCVDPAPQTGSLRGDLLDLLDRVRVAFNGPAGPAVRALLAEAAAGDAELVRTARSEVMAPRQRVLLEVLGRWAERGQVRPAAVTGRLAEIGPALLLYAYLVDGPPVPAERVAEVVDDVLLPLLGGPGAGAAGPASAGAAR